MLGLCQVAEWHPALADVWCSMDGIKLMIQSSGDDQEQIWYYNGWTCNNCVNAVLVFCPNETLLICCYNVSGTVYDRMFEIVVNFMINWKKFQLLLWVLCSWFGFHMQQLSISHKIRKAVSKDNIGWDESCSRSNVNASICWIGYVSISSIVSLG